jgi:hypothetical protein
MDSTQIRDVQLWEKSFRTDIMLAVHCVLQYALVDKLADAAGLPVSSSYRVVPRSPRPDLGVAMTRVCVSPQYPGLLLIRGAAFGDHRRLDETHQEGSAHVQEVARCYPATHQSKFRSFPVSASGTSCLPRHRYVTSAICGQSAV